MSDILGLLAECTQIATDLGYLVREEPLGEGRGGMCVVAGRRQILLNLEQPAGKRLETMLELLAAIPAVAGEPKSRALSERLADHFGR